MISFLTGPPLQFHISPDSSPQFVRGQWPNRISLKGLGCHITGMNFFCFPDQCEKVIFEIDAAVPIEGDGTQSVLDFDHLSN